MSSSDEPARSFSFDEGDHLFGFKPLAWQADFLHDTSREVMGSGAWGSGKTRAGLEKALLNSICYPGNRGLITRKTFASLENTTMEELFGKVLPESWILNHHKQRHLLKIRSPLYPTLYCSACGFETFEEIEFENQQCPSCEQYTLAEMPPSEIYYDGLNTGSGKDNRPEKIMSMELGWVFVDEASETSENDWTFLSGRLRHEDLNNPYVPKLPYRQIFGVTNPGSRQHWIYNRFRKRGIGVMYNSTTYDNPHTPEDYKEALETQLVDEVDKARYLEGEWRGYEGLVYDEYDDDVHAVNPLNVPDMFGGGWELRNQSKLLTRRQEHSDPVGNPDSPQYQPARVYPPENIPLAMSIDWGYRPDPTVIQWWAITPTHGYVLYRELFRTRTLPPKLAAEAMELMGAQESRQIEYVFSDHDSGFRDDWLRGAREWWETQRHEREIPKAELPDWRRLESRAAVKSKMEGISKVKEKLLVDDQGMAELYLIRGARAHQADRHLRSDDAPTSTLSELRSYSWKDGDSDEPQEDNDHGCDSMRYLVYSHHRRTRGSDRETARVHKA